MTDWQKCGPPVDTRISIHRSDFNTRLFPDILTGDLAVTASLMAAAGDIMTDNTMPLDMSGRQGPAKPEPEDQQAMQSQVNTPTTSDQHVAPGRKPLFRR
jgi:hypothetical protein